MHDRTDRRHFLRHATFGAATLGAGALAAAPSSAVEPVRRTVGTKFKFSLAAYSYRKLLSGASPQLTLIDFIEDCAKMGLEGTELTSYYFPSEVTDAFLRQMKAEAFRRGLDISGTAVGNDFCHPPGEERDAAIAHVKRWVEYADKMDAPVIRIFSGNSKDGQSVEEARRLAVEAIEACCDYAGRYGVFLALENHGGLTATAEDMLALVRAVKSPWFGVNLDTGNFHSSDVYAELAQIAPYAVNVQIKVSIKPAGQPRQRSDFRRLATLIKDAGYRGYIVLEHEENEDPRATCPGYIDELREAFA